VETATAVEINQGGLRQHSSWWFPPLFGKPCWVFHRYHKPDDDEL